MEDQEKKLVENKLLETDYRKFEYLDFVDCRFTFKGGEPPSFKQCSFTNCEWIFEGPARNALNLLRSFGETEEAQRMIVNTFLGFKL